MRVGGRESTTLDPPVGCGGMGTSGQRGCGGEASEKYQGGGKINAGCAMGAGTANVNPPTGCGEEQGHEQCPSFFIRGQLKFVV